MISQEDVENVIGTKINKLEQYRIAFTHKSASDKSYDNLEFIGDSVLGFVVTKYLYDMFGEEQNEGFLTKARTKIVRGTTLADISHKLGFYKWIQMDEKGMKNGWNMNSKILEDVFEAFIGALYLDLGLIYAREFILGILKKYPVDFIFDDNFKDQLMRICHSKKYNLPEYIVDSPINALFNVKVYISGVEYGSGSGTSKKQAEQNAAKCALLTLGRV